MHLSLKTPNIYAKYKHTYQSSAPLPAFRVRALREDESRRLCHILSTIPQVRLRRQRDLCRSTVPAKDWRFPGNSLVLYK